MRVLSATLLTILLGFGTGCSKSEPASESGDGDTAAKQKYTLDLAPREKVGARVRANLRTGVNTEILVQMGDRTLNEQRASASLDAVADVEVLTIDSKGEPTGIRSTVRSSSALRDGRSVEAIPAGTVVESRNVTGDEAVTGLPFALDPEINRLAEIIFSGSEPEDPTDQETFGTDQPQAIGDRWSIDVMQFRDDIGAQGFDLTTASVNGSATLVELTTVKGVECYHVHAEINIRGAKVEVPPDVTLEKSDATMTFDTYIPIDGNREIQENGTFEMELKARGQNGATETRRISQTYSRVFEPAATTN